MDNLDFDKRIREIMEGHTEEPATNSWNLIVSGLQRRRDARIRRIKRSIYTYSAVAAVLLLFVMINPGLFSGGNDIGVAENLSSGNLNQKRQEVAIIEQFKKPAEFAKERGFRGDSGASSNRMAAVELEPKEEQSQEDKQEKGRQVELTQKGGELLVAETKRAEDGAKQDNRVVRNILSDDLFGEDVPDRKTGGRPILALSTGLSPSYSGAYTPPGMMTRTYDGRNNVNPVLMSSEAPHESVFYGEEYMMPLTFGVQLFFPITKRFSVGTGVNYSILSAKYYVTSLNTNSTEHRRVTIHYGGIPLNLQYRILSGNRFGFYALGGTTIEKGLTAIDKNLRDGSVVDEKDEVKGIQLSVMAGLGAEYSISNSTALYADPNITYYFDNKKKPQPFSIRTVQPLLFRFEAGVRFRL